MHARHVRPPSQAGRASIKPQRPSINLRGSDSSYEYPTRKASPKPQTIAAFPSPDPGGAPKLRPHFQARPWPRNSLEIAAHAVADPQRPRLPSAFLQLGTLAAWPLPREGEVRRRRGVEVVCVQRWIWPLGSGRADSLAVNALRVNGSWLLALGSWLLRQRETVTCSPPPPGPRTPRGLISKDPSSLLLPQYHIPIRLTRRAIMGEKDISEGNGYDLNREGSTTGSNEAVEYNLANKHDQLERGLKSRHIQFLALGGAIGTGLFIGSGSILARTGPAPLFMAYLSMMLIVWVIMNDLAEMVTYLPMRGITVPYFVGRFVDPSLAFASGWNYWYAYSMLVGAEAVAAGIIIDYWNPPVNIALWIAVVLVVMLLLNIIAVSFFGEAEFWFASIKLITICGLIILGVVIFFGGGPNQDHILGFHYWKQPGAFKEYLSPGASGHFLAYWSAFISAGFAFITSPELIAIAAGEAVAPRRNIPKAARRFIWRLAIFYGIASLVIGILVPSDSKQLLGASNASASPFVIGIQNVGIPALNHIINGAVLTSAWSAGNSFLYSGSRVLYSMALNDQAPKWFRITNKYGVPWVAVLFTWCFGLLAFLNVSNSGATVFAWFMNISTISGYIAWIVVMITYLRFRRAMEFNGLLDTLTYRGGLQPYATYFALFMISLLTLTNGFSLFVKGNWNTSSFIAAYITLPIFLALYLGHKVWFRTPLCIRTSNIDCITGKKEMDELEAMDVPPVAKNWVEKVWFWLA
ncbi:hypothetical protein G7046_g6040 [Stylonectria norvegica]|nr:hypothetical protein G7046_g6040 [Stylonectria norvegica]